MTASHGLYVSGTPVGEDSVPITTVRSFNAETITFTADYPFAIGVEAKDSMETERARVPSAFSGASTYTSDQVGAKDGFDEIDWDPTAQLVWGADLESDNILLLRTTVTG